VDYPTIEDDTAGLLFSGLNRRAAVVHKLLKQTGIHESDCSFASICSCVIKSKSIINVSDYTYCASYFLEEAIKDINPSGIIAFGATAGEFLTGEKIMNIENTRGKVYYRGQIPVIVTYQLGVISGKGCSSCGSATTYSHFVRVDFEKMYMLLKSAGVKFKKG